MQNLVFLGIILVGKEKIQNKNTKTIQKQNKKKIKASHFAAETEGRSTEASPAGPRGGQEGPQPHRVTPGKNHTRKRKRKAGWGPNCRRGQKGEGSGVFCS